MKIGFGPSSNVRAATGFNVETCVIVPMAKRGIDRNRLYTFLVKSNINTCNEMGFGQTDGSKRKNSIFNTPFQPTQPHSEPASPRDKVTFIPNFRNTSNEAHNKILPGNYPLLQGNL